LARSRSTTELLPLDELDYKQPNSLRQSSHVPSQEQI
jgi:hypothetical protein